MHWFFNDPRYRSTNDRKMKVPGVIGCNVLLPVFKDDGAGTDFLKTFSPKHWKLSVELYSIRS